MAPQLAGTSLSTIVILSPALYSTRGIRALPHSIPCYSDGQLSDHAAQAKKGDTDVLICDTSGRLHTNYELMEELEGCKQALSKRMQGAPHEVLLVLDGTTGVAAQHQHRFSSSVAGAWCC